jgi:hypothetical protein
MKMRMNGSMTMAASCLTLVAVLELLAGDTQTVSSVNVVGYFKPNQGVLRAKGEVVTLGTHSLFPRVQGTRIPVILEVDTQCVAGEVSTYIAGEEISRQWIEAPDGRVEKVAVGGKALSLSEPTIRNGCLSTTKYGNVPVFIHLPWNTDATGTNLCILVFPTNELKSLRSQHSVQGPKTATDR